MWLSKSSRDTCCGFADGGGANECGDCDGTGKTNEGGDGDVTGKLSTTSGISHCRGSACASGVAGVVGSSAQGIEACGAVCGQSNCLVDSLK